MTYDEDVLKTCTKCGGIFPATREFFYGHKTGKNGLTPSCKTCCNTRDNKHPKSLEARARRAETLRAWRCNNPEKASDAKWEWRCKNVAKTMIDGAKHRAKKRDLPFDLSAYAVQVRQRLEKGKCELSGIPFVRTRGKLNPLSPSLDRIVPAAGYVYSNIRIICQALNASFGDWGEETCFHIVKAWLRTRDKLVSVAPKTDASIEPLPVALTGTPTTAPG